MKSVLTVVLLTYTFFCLAFFLLQRKSLYFPQPATEVAGVSEISFDTDGVQLKGWVLNQGQTRA